MKNTKHTPVYLENCPNCISRYNQFYSVHAAAPELLEACKYVLKQAGLSVNSPSYKKLTSALAKVEGKQ